MEVKKNIADGDPEGSIDPISDEVYINIRIFNFTETRNRHYYCGIKKNIHNRTS